MGRGRSKISKSAKPAQQAPKQTVTREKTLSHFTHSRRTTDTYDKTVEFVRKEGFSEGDAIKIVNAFEFYTKDGKGYEEMRESPELYKKEIKAIDDYMEKHPVYGKTIYRGLRVSKETLDAAIKSGEWKEPGLTSFTSARYVANWFISGTKGEPVILVDKNNKTGVSIRHLSPGFGEHEVLKPSNIKDRGFKILRSYKRSGITYLEVEEND